jgi:hypothetical protein
VIREKALHLTKDEVPHALTVEIDERDERSVRAFVLVETESQKGILVGKRGAMIREIGTRADPRSRRSSAARSSWSSSSRCGRAGGATARRSSASASEPPGSAEPLPVGRDPEDHALRADVRRVVVPVPVLPRERVDVLAAPPAR